MSHPHPLARTGRGGYFLEGICCLVHGIGHRSEIFLLQSSEIFSNFALMQPSLYIIAGCNGAGKSTASYSLLPDLLDCQEYVNADEIAKGLSPFNPAEMAILAGKLMLQRIEWLLNAAKTFAIETTLSAKSYAILVKKHKSSAIRSTSCTYGSRRSSRPKTVWRDA